MPRLIVRGSTLGANRFGGTSIPIEDVAAGGKGSVFQLRRSRLSYGFGVIRDLRARPYEKYVSLIVRRATLELR